MAGKGKAAAEAASTRGQWMPSNVTVGTITELQADGYVPFTAKCRSPVGKDGACSASAIPAPRKGERVVFISHLLRGLGFPIHPFLRGLLFFYGLDFHHLAPNSILHIATFITFCEAFLRIEPHFGLWLKIFCIKPFSSGSRLADCGGAMVSKIPNVPWPKGTFIETVKLWQQEWFYIADQASEDQGEGPAFSAGPPKRLYSWTAKGLDWGNQAEVKELQEKVKAVVDTGLKLTDVVHVMLHRRILPLQTRATPMWRHKATEEVTIQRFFRGVDLAGMWRLLFKTKDTVFPTSDKDTGFRQSLQAPEDWRARARLMRCPAPQPEDPKNDVLEKLLVEDPYKVPIKTKKEEKKAKAQKDGVKTRTSSLAIRENTSDLPEESYQSSPSASNAEEIEAEESEEYSSPGGKRAASEDAEAVATPRALKRLRKASTAPTVQASGPTGPTDSSSSEDTRRPRERPPPTR